MNEKTRLLQLFAKVEKATDMFKMDSEKINSNDRLSRQGKAEEIKENKQQVLEAYEGFRELMLRIVDEKEADFVAFHVKEVKGRLGSADYQNALRANLDSLEKGFMGRIEIKALLELYKCDDLAMQKICSVLEKTKSQYMDMVEDRITMDKQLNAYASIRNLIRAKVNLYLIDAPVEYVGEYMGEPGALGRTLAYFGSGYQAFLDELNEDLSLNRPDAALASAANADAASWNRHSTDVEKLQMEAKLARKKAAEEDAAKAKPPQKREIKIGNLGSIPPIMYPAY